MTTSNVPVPTFTTTGLSMPAEQELLAGVQQDWVSAFALVGKSLVTDLTTPQGQIMTAQAYMLANFDALLAKLISEVDPATADGVFQDALARIYFLTRHPATSTLVTATITGTPGTNVPAGTQAVTVNDDIFVLTQSVTISNSSTVSGIFASQVVGSVPCGAGELNRWYQRVAGADSLTNAAPGVLGAAAESRVDFEQRRADSVQIGGIGQIQTIRAAVANLAGVTDVFAYDNATSAPITYGATNYPIPANSIVVSVTGGDGQTIANTIWGKKDVGAGYATSGATLYTVQDTTGYVAPYPTYNVYVLRPAATQVYFIVNLLNGPNVPANYATQVQNAIIAAFTSGADGQPKARIGGQIRAARFVQTVANLGNNIVPVSITIGLTSGAGNASVTMGVDQQPVTAVENIVVNLVSG
ncbi:hypothetical protein T2_00044 [Ralstonia phage Elie]|uniref:Baseplate protein J-like barrel domain-containing protein n=2 Tax=Bakolyvirus simangalove TaxID=2846051 RepID=A0A7G5BBS3_9CAUD|nr:hypothetical protein KE332_gp44 [Ralstonia phage Adzire]YP_010077731.1 hypothetical protein KMC38_gp44 [Ralstonia phage Simangalove]QMV32989.1 hypothetical protein T2_00044 [Ralstonia phage Elie]QMV33701.1 hypothetical protein S3_00057 [Ralstonia phage Sarlave]QMV32361.1 hypothetical protein S1_00044 [Ralstonia phage Adzire]QMV33746.1 hypothetical protein R1_00044 [Ralstonia phage Simangalove]